MKVRLLHPQEDFDWKWALLAAARREATRTNRRHYPEVELPFDPQAGLPWNKAALTDDLALDTIVSAMAKDDDCIFEVSRKVLLSSARTELNTVRYRQGILRDLLEHSSVARELYALAVDAINDQKRHWLGSLARQPGSVLHDSRDSVGSLLAFLKKLRASADLYANRFVSEGLTNFFAMLKRDLDEDYLASVGHCLEDLRFPAGELISAQLGNANKGTRHILHQTPRKNWTWTTWLTKLFEDGPTAYSFELHPRDEAGARDLASLRNRGISLAADALGQAANHVRDFFKMLRVELAFYVGCLNLRERLSEKGEPTCIPTAFAPPEKRLSCRGLYDVGLTLSVESKVIGTDIKADGKELTIVTGPNGGGKSTFLRSVGLAQLLMQSGMFVPAESYSASISDGLFTHYKREEDRTMKSGKFDEELSRMSAIVDHLLPHSMVLFNESFAATNEREGSEIASQIISALVEKGVRVIFVTHMYEFSRLFYEKRNASVLFLRADRKANGTRTFKMIEAEPLPRSFGEELYNRIFRDGVTASAHENDVPTDSIGRRTETS